MLDILYSVHINCILIVFLQRKQANNNFKTIFRTMADEFCQGNHSENLGKSEAKSNLMQMYFESFCEVVRLVVAYYENYIWMATYHQVQPQVNILHLTFYYNCHFMLNVHPADFFTCCIKYHPPPPPPPPKCPVFYYLDISIS